MPQNNNSVVWSKNPIFFTSDELGSTDKAQLRVLVEDSYLSGTFNLLATLELPASASGNATFRIDTLLDAILEADAEKDIILPGHTWRVHRYTARKFYVQQRVISIGSTSEWVASDPQIVALGGVPYYVFPSDNFWDPDQSQGMGPQLALNNRPAILEVRKAPLYLTLFGYAGSAGIVRYTFSSSDGGYRIVDKVLGADTNSTLEVDTTILAVHSFLLNEWPLAGELSVFRVQFIEPADDGNGYGPTSFNLDPSFSPFERTFLYRNSKGGLETLVCTGAAAAKIDVDRQIATRAIQPGYMPSQPTSFAANVTASQKVKVATGWFENQDEAARVSQELMLARQVYELKGEMWLPILLSTKSLQYQTDGEYLAAFSFEYEYGFETSAFSKL